MSHETEWYILNSEHEPVLSTTIGFSKWCDTTPGIRLVAQDILDDGTRVSTIFLGLDHSFEDEGPILFETMIFGEFSSDDYQVRYKTWDEAVEGHKRALMVAKAGEWK